MKKLFKSLFFATAVLASCNEFAGDDVLNTCPQAPKKVSCIRDASGNLIATFNFDPNTNSTCIPPDQFAVNVPWANNWTVSSGPYTANNNAPLPLDPNNPTVTVTIPNAPAKAVIEVLQFDDGNKVSDTPIPLDDCDLPPCANDTGKECVAINGMDATITWKLELCDPVKLFLCLCGSNIPFKPWSNLKRKVHNADGSISSEYRADPNNAILLDLKPGQYVSVDARSATTIPQNGSFTIEVKNQAFLDPKLNIPPQKLFPVSDSDCGK